MPPHQDLPDREFAAVALDLISGIVEGLGSSIEDLIGSTNQNIAWIILECLKVSFPLFILDMFGETSIVLRISARLLELYTLDHLG